MTASQPDLSGYGGFEIAGMQLALPLAVLREVVPLNGLMPLPCPSPAVIGAINLRGLLLPVLDLRRVLGVPLTEAAFPIVIVMGLQGRLLGLLADGITGIFYSPASSVRRATVDDAVAGMLAGSVSRPDDGVLVSVLSPEAISALPHVPMMMEQPAVLADPATESAVQDAPVQAPADALLSMLLMRCGRTPLALDSAVVHTTLSNVDIEPSALRVGLCLGEIVHGEQRIPAVDLLTLCRLGARSETSRPHAVVLRLPAGLVALIIDEVIDVVRLAPGEVLPVPAFALSEPGLFAGVLPASALSADLVQRCPVGEGQFLVLDGPALVDWPVLRDLASVRNPEAPVAGLPLAAAQQITPTAARRALITFELHGETAVPIEQVAEILPFQPQTAHFMSQGALLGLMTSRGRSIPLLCLQRLTGAASATSPSPTSVLIVQSEGDWIGFAVPRLHSIEQASWEPERTLPGLSGSKLVQLGSGEDQRLVRLLDLAQLALSLRRQRLAA